MRRLPSTWVRTCGEKARAAVVSGHAETSRRPGCCLALCTRCAGWDINSSEQTYASVQGLTIVMWATTVPMGMLGYLLSWLRLRWFNTSVLRQFMCVCARRG